MKENEIIQEQIDQYLTGKMTKPEMEAFDAKMEKDSELKQEVALQRSIIKAVRKEQLEKIIQKQEKEIKSGRIRRIVISVGSFAVAASLSGIFYVSYLNNCENISNRYFESYSYTPVPSRGDEPSLTKADSIFFDAIHHLETGEQKAAINQLERIDNESEEMIAATGDAVKWYLSLAYLKNGQKKKARNLLQILANNPNSDYQAKAKELLNDL